MNIIEFVRDAPGEYYASLPQDRDLTELHVSDITKCLHDVWRRRNGLPFEPPSVRSRMCFARGRDIEKELVTAYRIKYESAAWNVYGGNERMFVRLSPIDDDGPGQWIGNVFNADDFACGFDEIRGETDFVAIDDRARRITLIEIKSHGFMGPAPKFAHVLQVATYALAISLTREFAAYELDCLLVDVSTVSGEIRESTIEWTDYVPEITRRLGLLLSTGVDHEAPDQTPPEEAWQMKGRGSKKVETNTFCDGYCPQHACTQNIHSFERAGASDSERDELSEVG